MQGTHNHFLFSFRSSIVTDIALIKENARVAAQIAVELEKLQYNGEDRQEEMKITRNKAKPASSSTPLVVGGSILDIHYHVNEENLKVSKTIVTLKQ